MRIVFFGTPDFSVPSLASLIEAGYEIQAVVTQPDTRKGRNRHPTPSPVKELTVSKGLPVLQPLKMKDPIFLDEIKRIAPELIAVVAYGNILPPQILTLPSYGCINVHASLLPKYRGAAPIQWAIINGEKDTGITTMLMDEGLDTGDVLLKEAVEIYDDDNAETLSARLSNIGSSLLVKTVQGIREDSLKPTPQTGTPTYAPPLKKEDGKIDWSKTSKEISNFVRGMFPWPCAYCYLKNERIKISKVRVLEGSDQAGIIVKAHNELIIGTGDGLISILQLQPEGKKVMSVKDFLLGRRLKEGTFFNES
jgi:methionyl-tRNA formyltransferase